MTVKELITELQNFHEDKVVVICGESGGWCNIDSINAAITVNLMMEEDPVFSEN